MWKHRRKTNDVNQINQENMKGKPEIPENSRLVHVTNQDVFARWFKSYAQKRLPIYICADFDCDGIASTAGMHNMCVAYGVKETVRTPRREEGYGMSVKIVSEFKKPGVIITLDNGITAFEAIEEAKRRGFIVIVIDHHQPLVSDGKIVLPKADLIIDPHVPDELISKNSKFKSDYRDYCGAGLVCKMAQLLISNESVYADISAVAAIATVADVVSLTGDNVAIYREGMRAIEEKRISPGIQKLVDVLRTGNKVSEKDIGFVLGALLNAPGRVTGDSSLSVQALLAKTYAEGFNLVSSLCEINEKRKTLKAEGIARAEEYIADKCLFGDNPIVVYDPSVLPGVAGLVAGDITNKYYATSIVLTDSDDPEIIKGSCRAPYGNIKAALDKVNDVHPEFFAGYGGHEKAAGVSIVKKHLDEFTEAMQEAMGPAMEKSDDVEYDAEIAPDKIEETTDKIRAKAPYGEGHPPIIVRINGVKLSPKGNTFYEKIGDSSVKFYGAGCEFVGFGLLEKYLGERMPKTVDVVGELSYKYFLGKKTIQMEMIDFARTEEEESEPTELEEDISAVLKNVGLLL